MPNGPSRIFSESTVTAADTAHTPNHKSSFFAIVHGKFTTSRK